ncbi:PREDICTED: regulation of nuclear pre-mRNA domain-containing protein 1B [Nicotiana attenuata]|uniref:CID domain-containing protein n=2 Tax=Nicotiana attenuata TaxID=49451 RepID=A0A314L4Q0_NICAT|nr:PREDICTED: regulation of nuclear pre-mRNA domain-containing protein 1B [Nicotiana attenuata]OIT36137.1 hypothetical protein A4A49_30938 [Nicotiana attenuata]
MGTTFNTQILVDKLAKLNSTQQSIETLSHWCIFHMNKAKQVVETWAQQFHCSPREQRLAFLYLANDILQNSRRKGSEFVGEFWKVLPDALRDVIENGNEFGRNAALRLITIWEERKVFGSRGQLLKEEFAGKHVGNGKHSGVKVLDRTFSSHSLRRNSTGDALDKIVSSYQMLYGGQIDEDAILSRCKNAISSVDKLDKEIGGDLNPGHLNGSGIADELKGQHTILKDCIEQLTTVESSRANLISHLREVLQEQEYKLDQVRNQLQAAQSHADQAGNICKQLLNCDANGQILAEQNRKEASTSQAAQAYVAGNREQSAPVMYTRQVSYEKSGNLDEDMKSAAAAVAAKLTASTSSAQMLTYVLSSLASEGVIGNSSKESSHDNQSEKRVKLENDHSAYVPSQNPQEPLSFFSQSFSMQHNLPSTAQESAPIEPPPLPSSPPPLPPLPPMQPYPVPQCMQTCVQIPNSAFVFATSQQPSALPGFPQVVPPANGVSPYTSSTTNAYQGYSTDSSLYSQSSSLPMAPVTRQ